MAFIDFKDGALQAISGLAEAPFPAGAIAGTAQALTLLERRVVELARGDGLATLRPHRKRHWLAKLVFGPQPPSPVLANERLEALRRLAVQAWHHGYQLPASALKEAHGAGFDETQISAALDMVARLREPFRRLAA